MSRGVSDGTGSFDGNFPSTLWSSVLSAGGGSHQALETLAGRYWRPVYSYLRRAGRKRDEAADLTQGFFVLILEGRLLQVADRNRGRFRTFLLACLKNFLANEYDREQAQKRGGGARILSLDVEEAEQALHPATSDDPDREFERQWAHSILDRAVSALNGKIGPRDAHIFSLVHDDSGFSYRQIAERFDLSEDGVAQCVHRARIKLRELIVEEIRSTVDSADQVPEELEALMTALSSPSPPKP